MQTLNSQLQQKHPLVPTSNFASMDEYVGHLIHAKGYEEAAGFARGKSVLDWGCNNGYGLELMRSLGCADISGLDVSPEAIEAARERLGPETPLILHTGNDAPLTSGTYDVVTSLQCIEHVEDVDRYLAEIRRVLNPDGVAIFTTPNGAIRIDRGMKPWNEYHVVEFFPEDLRALLSKHFSSVTISGLFATDELQRTEIIRCARARRDARGKTVVGTVRDLLPLPIRRFIRRHTLNGRRPELTYSTADLFYSKDKLESALDLLAICSNLHNVAEPRTNR
jgi:2-polyprenyl-3-methyl-5-hydroxy-6-metoxy-1,4-benzoquinol methylase